MAFTYNSALVFQHLDKQNRLDEVFEQWLAEIEKDEFVLTEELRKNIFGLSAIIKTPEEQLQSKQIEIAGDKPTIGGYAPAVNLDG